MLESMKAAEAMILYQLPMLYGLRLLSSNPSFLSSVWAEIWDIKKETGNDMRQDLVAVYETCQLSSGACLTALIPDT